MKVLGIIPARGGSKRIPRKNLVELAGKPLLWHTFSACAGSRLLSEVVLSTEDDEIADYAAGEGVAVVRRPSELATDTANNIAVWQHAVRAMGERDGGRPEAFVNLNPTSPLRTASDIDDAIRMLEDTGCDAVFGVTALAVRPDKIHRIDAEGRMDFCWPFRDEARLAAKQLVPAYHVLNGAITAARTAVLDRGDTWPDLFLAEGTDLRALVMPRARSVDVDDHVDLALCEHLLRAAPQQGEA